MSGQPRGGAKTRQAECWLVLKRIGPCSIQAVVDAMGVKTKVAYSRIRDLRAAGYADASGPQMHKIYWAVGDKPPDDGRREAYRNFRAKGLRARYNLRDFHTCNSVEVVMQWGREGTPGEIPRIPSLAEMLAR